MPRQRYQRGTLATSVPGNSTRPERKLPRGTFWGQWYQYVRKADGSEGRRREKIITKDLAAKYGIAKDYDGPLTKTDAQRVLEALIAEDTGAFVPPDREATFEQLAREYIAPHETSWGPHMALVAKSIIQRHLVGKLGCRPVADLTEIELQQFVNGYVKERASNSLLKKILAHLRGIMKYARKKRLIDENPAEDIRAKSRKRVCERTLTVDECRRMLSVLMGRDRLILRVLIQLGLRPEEVFALRRDDVGEDSLRVDEAIVFGSVAPVKTDASSASVYMPPDLAFELRSWIECSPGESGDWLFTHSRGRGPGGPLNSNNYRKRVLQPAAIRAGVGVTDSGEKDPDGQPVLETDVTFQALRRTCATLFGDRAKDPKTTQAQLPHADPSITLKHYQKSVPQSVKAAAVMLEAELTGDRPGSRETKRGGLQ